MADLALTHIINISVTQTPTGLGQFNVNNVALMTDEVPGTPFASGFQIYLTASAVAKDFGSSSQTAKMATALFSQSPNILAGGGYLVIATRVGSEDLLTMIQRVQPLVQFHGILFEFTQTDAQVLAAADYVQTQTMMLFTGSQDSATLTVTTGLFWKIFNRGDTQTRCQIYLNGTYNDAVVETAAYCGRALSTDFAGSNTTQTMHMKNLATISVDANMTETLFNAAVIAGADMYASFRGVPKVFSTGANRFFDQVYNQAWFVSALQTGLFNVLAQTTTKIPQTERGVGLLKSAARLVCAQAVSNGYVAPGTWTSPDTFGNPVDFLRVISEQGFYVFTLPLSQQSASDRAARKSPLVQIALKEAGAIHSSNILININA